MNELTIELCELYDDEAPAVGLVDLPDEGPVSLQWWTDIIHEEDGRLAFGCGGRTLDRFASRPDAMSWLGAWQRLAGRQFGEGVLMLCCAETGEVVGGPWPVG